MYVRTVTQMSGKHIGSAILIAVVISVWSLWRGVNISSSSEARSGLRLAGQISHTHGGSAFKLQNKYVWHLVSCDQYGGEFAGEVGIAIVSKANVKIEPTAYLSACSANVSFQSAVYYVTNSGWDLGGWEYVERVSRPETDQYCAMKPILSYNVMWKRLGCIFASALLASYAVIRVLNSAWAARSNAVRRDNLRKGLCQHCGYKHMSQSVCSECGGDVSGCVPQHTQ
jgi:hypothetical protein